jgi:hypothetical protein
MRRYCPIQKILSVIAFLLLFVPLSASGATHYVRPTFSGTHDGNSWTTAYSGLPATLTRGDTYVLAGGSYSAYTFDDSGTSMIMVRKASKASSGHGYNDDAISGWQDSYETTQATFPNIVFTQSHYNFDGVTGGGPTAWKTGHGFKIGDGSHCYPVDTQAYVTDVAVRHTELQGDLSTSCNGDANVFHITYATTEWNPIGTFTVSYCYAYDTMGGFFYSRGTDGLTIEYSYFWNNGKYNGSDYRTQCSNQGEGDPWHREAWSGGGTGEKNAIIRYSFFGDICGTGFIGMMNGSGTLDSWQVYGNVFYNPSYCGDTSQYITDGVLGIKIGVGMNPVNWNVHNNTFVNISGINLTGSVDTCSGTCTAYNNLYYSNYTQYIRFNNASMGQDYSWVYGNQNCFNGGGASTDGQVTSAEAHGVLGSGDPFVDSANQDFRLASHTAPGHSLASPYNVDAYGNTRTNWDRGAYEYSGGDTTPPTVTAFVITPTAYNNRVVPIATFTATDAVGVTGYCVNESATAPTAGSCSGSGWAGTAQTSYTFASDGSKTLYGWADDAAGNISSSLSDTVIVDTVNPTISISTNGGSDFNFMGTSIILTGTASDSGSGLSTVTSGQGSVTGTATWSLPVSLSYGPNVITVTAQDAATNAANAQITVTRIPAKSMKGTTTNIHGTGGIH